MPLIKGRYPVTNPLWSTLGQPVQNMSPMLAPRTNLTGLTGLTDSAALTSGVMTVVPVPVEVSDIILKVSVLVGATAEASGTHAWAAIYTGPGGQGSPQLIAQSADNTSAAALGASGRYDFTLINPAELSGRTSGLAVSQAMAPQGYLYAAICVTATTVPTLAGFTVPTAVSYPWFPNSPLRMGAVTTGTALAGTAPASFTSSTPQAVTPAVFLS